MYDSVQLATCLAQSVPTLPEPPAMSMPAARMKPSKVASSRAGPMRAKLLPTPPPADVTPQRNQIVFSRAHAYKRLRGLKHP